MTGDPTTNPKVREAGRWLATLSHDQRPRPIIPRLCEKFDLKPHEAVAAIREATLMNARAN